MVVATLGVALSGLPRKKKEEENVDFSEARRFFQVGVNIKNNRLFYVSPYLDTHTHTNLKIPQIGKMALPMADSSGKKRASASQQRERTSASQLVAKHNSSFGSLQDSAFGINQPMIGWQQLTSLNEPAESDSPRWNHSPRSSHIISTHEQ